MDKKIFGVFDTRDEAEAARDDLIDSGYDSSDIDIIDRPPGEAGAAAATTRTEPVGLWDRIVDFFGMEDREYYTEASRRGGLVVAVTAPEDEIDRAVAILQQHNPVDLKTRGEEWRKSGWTGTRAEATPRAEATTPRGKEDTIPVVEERLQVGKLIEERGGVRIYSRVIETPVEQDVQLSEETVRVERRGADRPATAADFKEQTIEATEKREKPVVRKEARVVEEVGLSKETKQRTEKVRDKVKRTKVDVQQLDKDYQRDFESRYAGKNYTYDQMRVAYDFGQQLAERPTYERSGWTQIEPEARRLFEEKNPGTWDHYKDAVRYGFERSKRQAA